MRVCVCARARHRGRSRRRGTPRSPGACGTAHPAPATPPPQEPRSRAGNPARVRVTRCRRLTCGPGQAPPPRTATRGRVRVSPPPSPGGHPCAGRGDGGEARNGGRCPGHCPFHYPSHFRATIRVIIRVIIRVNIRAGGRDLDGVSGGLEPLEEGPLVRPRPRRLRHHRRCQHRDPPRRSATPP